MRLLSSLNDLADAVADAAALKGQIDALKAQLPALQEKIAAATNAKASAYAGWQRDRFGGVGVDRFNAYLGAQDSAISLAQGEIERITGQINELAVKAAESQAKTQADDQAAADAKAVAQANSPFERAMAERKAAEEFNRQISLMNEPGYDMGRGSHRRNVYYRESGLGGNMQGVLNLHRPRAGLGFDVFGAIAQGAKAGYAQYQAERPAGGVALPKIGNPFGGILPSWLNKAQLPLSVRRVGGGIVSSVSRAVAAKPPANPSAIAATTVAVDQPPAGGSPNLLLWGGIAIAGSILAWKALKE